jgi:hypothetical protein
MMDFGRRETMPMTEENTAQFLGRREQELIARIKALKGQLNPLEAELVQVQNMRALLPGSPQHNSLSPNYSEARKALVEALTPSASNPLTSPYQGMTITELTVQALLDSFPDGATPGEIYQFIQTAYRREIEQPSFRTQLHRLKNAGILEAEGLNLLKLTNTARRNFAMYDHPSSRKVMKELQDEP